MRHRIKLTRRHLGMTQVEFAALLGVHWRAVQNWEAGVNYPRPSTLRRLAEVSERPVSWFYELEETAA